MRIKTTAKLLLSKLGIPGIQLRLAEKMAILAETGKNLPINGDPQGKRILIVGMQGFPRENMLESFIALSLNFRNACTRVMLCNHTLPACDASRINSGFHPTCDACVATSNSVYKSLGLDCLYIGNYLSASDFEAADKFAAGCGARVIKSAMLGGIDVGAYAYTALQRFTINDHPETYPEYEEIFQRFLRAGALLYFATEKIVQDFKPDLILTSHGVYVNWGIPLAVTKRHGIPNYIWAQAYRKNTYNFTKDHHWIESIRIEPRDLWKSFPFEDAQRDQIAGYLDSRVSGKNDIIKYYVAPIEDPNKIISDYGLDATRPIYCMFPNIAWDAASAYKDIIFDDMNDWVIQTVEWFSKRPDLQLVIRAHPGELRLHIKTEEGVGKLLKSHYPSLPGNVKFIGPEDQASSYAFSQIARVSLVFTGKLGLELSAKGLPTIVTGKSFYRDRGFTLDPRTREEYFALLDNPDPVSLLPSGFDQLALQFAHYYFFRRSVALPLVDASDPQKVMVENLRMLTPGGNRDVDWLCTKILNNEEVIYSDKCE